MWLYCPEKNPYKNKQPSDFLQDKLDDHTIQYSKAMLNLFKR